MCVCVYVHVIKIPDLVCRQPCHLLALHLREAVSNLNLSTTSSRSTRFKPRHDTPTLTTLKEHPYATVRGFLPSRGAYGYAADRNRTRFCKPLTWHGWGAGERGDGDAGRFIWCSRLHWGWGDCGLLFGVFVVAVELLLLMSGRLVWRRAVCTCWMHVCVLLATCRTCVSHGCCCSRWGRCLRAAGANTEFRKVCVCVFFFFIRVHK